jgi:hypothetical protein
MKWIDINDEIPPLHKRVKVLDVLGHTITGNYYPMSKFWSLDNGKDRVLVPRDFFRFWAFLEDEPAFFCASYDQKGNACMNQCLVCKPTTAQ